MATVTDSQGMSAQAATSVVIGSVTGAWSVSYTPLGASAPIVDRLVLNQDQSQVTGTIETSCTLGTVTGSVSNPLGLSINASVTCDVATLSSYTGTLNAALSMWTGTVTDGGRCRTRHARLRQHERRL